ncbi:MAG: SurA N-terminal domain-containing protein, partial [Deferribacteraceae bacterium]|nr:SurA N-terminal domain-containing protein [Deferribacteraceae bacterium]
MLAAMRKKKILNLFLWLVIIAFLATIVVVWGLGDNQATTNYVAKIDDTQISYLEYSRAYENTANQMRQLYGSLADTLLSTEGM